jgi:transposase-like protein
MTFVTVHCPHCDSEQIVKRGKTRRGTQRGTGSVSCNSAFVLHLCRFLNHEDLMQRKAMVQDP